MNPGLYRHYKGQEYFIVGTAHHSESGDELVLYYAVQDADAPYWVRPVDSFTEMVVVNGSTVPRFQWVRSATQAEIARHTTDSVASPVAAQPSVSQATETEPESNWVQSIISVLGAGVFGLGVILFFAYNWEVIPKFGKLAIVFASVIVFHGLGLFFGRRLTGAMRAVDASYHMDEHFPTAFLIWGLGVLALAWFLPSVWQGLLAVVLFTAWGTAESVVFDDAGFWPIVATLSIVPLAFFQRSRVLLFIAIASAWLLTVYLTEQRIVGDVNLLIHLYVAPLLIGVSLLVERTRWSFAAAPIRGAGGLVYAFSLLLVAKFHIGDVPSLMDWNSSLEVSIVSGVFCLAVLFLLASLVITILRDGFTIRLLQILGVIAGTVLLAVAHEMQSRGVYGHILQGPSSILLILHSTFFIITGLNLLTRWRVVFGCLLLITVVIWNFIVETDNMFVRSLAFLSVGLLMIVVGSLYRRRRVQMQSVGTAHA